MAEVRAEKEPVLEAAPLERFRVERAKSIARMERNGTPDFIQEAFKAIAGLLIKIEESPWKRSPIIGTQTVSISQRVE